MIQLGSTVKDKISGFQGVVTGYVTYITGCNQVLVCPKVGKDGAMASSEWIDEQRLDVLDEKAFVLDNGDAPGFDRAPPKR